MEIGTFCTLSRSSFIRSSISNSRILKSSFNASKCMVFSSKFGFEMINLNAIFLWLLLVLMMTLTESMEIVHAVLRVCLKMTILKIFETDYLEGNWEIINHKIFKSFSYFKVCLIKEYGILKWYASWRNVIFLSMIILNIPTISTHSISLVCGIVCPSSIYGLRSDGFGKIVSTFWLFVIWH